MSNTRSTGRATGAGSTAGSAAAAAAKPSALVDTADKEEPDPAPAAEPAAQAVVSAGEPQEQAVVAASMEEIDMGAYAGAGLEEAKATDFAIPFLRVLQTNSPEADETHAKFIEGAKPGMLYNTVTQRLYDGKEGALFVPCHYERKQLRWAPRGSGKQGYRGEVTEAEAMTAREAGKLVDHEGRTYFTDDGKVDDKKNDRLVDTRFHFGLLLSEEGIPAQVLMTLVSTQIKKSKLFNAMQNERTRMHKGKLMRDPSFANIYRIVTVKESNDQGSWFGVHITHHEPVRNPAVFDFGRMFWEALKRNEIKVDIAASADDAGTEAPAGDPGKF